MTDADEEIKRLEDQFPLCAGVAFSNARKRVLASGQSVLQTEEGGLYEVFPDGGKVFLKKMDPPVKVQLGLKIRLG
jgi:hypothetical protein